MDPITAGLFVAASFASNIFTSRQQSKAIKQANKIETEQARLQASEAAYERTKQFRQNISTNLALSGIGVGGVNGARGATAQNVSDYFADISAINTGDVFAQLGSKANTKRRKAGEMADYGNAATNAVNLATQLDLFKKNK